LGEKKTCYEPEVSLFMTLKKKKKREGTEAKLYIFRDANMGIFIRGYKKKALKTFGKFAG
jgi:hypothetical protein